LNDESQGGRRGRGSEAELRGATESFTEDLEFERRFLELSKVKGEKRSEVSK